jgi:membrane protein
MAHYKFSDVLSILKSSSSEFSNNNSFRHAAALSYYTIFSLPPLLLIVITIASKVYGAEAVTGQVYGQLKGLVGADSAKFLQDSIASFTKQERGGWHPNFCCYYLLRNASREHQRHLES